MEYPMVLMQLHPLIGKKFSGNVVCGSVTECFLLGLASGWRRKERSLGKELCY